MRALRVTLLVAVAGCASASAPRAPGTAALPRAAPASASLGITVVYPKPADPIQAPDSSFLFGSVGRGDAEFTINGVPVPVLPNGAWLAWVPLPDDTVAYFRLAARAGGDSQVTVFAARLAPRFHPPPRRAWIDTTSFAPAGTLAFPTGEGIRLSVRAAPGALVRLRPARGAVVPFVADTLPAEPAWGVRAFGTDPAAYRLAVPADRYVAWLPAAPLCADSAATGPCATLEVVADGDTASALWPLALELLDPSRPSVVVLTDDTTQGGTPDSLTMGKAIPWGTYHWFFALGTTAVVSGRWNDQVRLQLSRTAVAWVNAAEAAPLPPGTPPPGGSVGSVRLTPGPRSLMLRVLLPARVPFHVAESDRSLTLRLYGVAADINWMQYGGTDPYVTRMSYAQPAADEVTITLELAGAVWGYRTRWDGRDLLLEIRRPPAIDPAHPLRGRTVVLDPGHPPLGATGPAGLRESDATLTVALKARDLLERAGATALLTRTDTAPLDLYPRVRFAEQHDADVLVSIHANALPDGVNPFVNNGTSVYYFHPRSAALARVLDRALVAEFGIRDLGIGRGDYALVRPTWMPSALTEGLFLMIPEQEALLASAEGQWRYARGLVNGIRAFLRARARDR